MDIRFVFKFLMQVFATFFQNECRSILHVFKVDSQNSGQITQTSYIFLVQSFKYDLISQILLFDIQLTMNVFQNLSQQLTLLSYYQHQGGAFSRCLHQTYFLFFLRQFNLSSILVQTLVILSQSSVYYSLGYLMDLFFICGQSNVSNKNRIYFHLEQYYIQLKIQRLSYMLIAQQNYLSQLYQILNNENQKLTIQLFTSIEQLLYLIEYYLVNYLLKLQIKVTQYKQTMSQGNKNSIETLPIRAYLDETVIPLVLKALSELAQQRQKPENPIEYIADYLLKHNPEDKEALQANPQ